MDKIYEQPKTGLGSAEETNRLLQEASQQTGIAAPTFSPTGAITSDTLSGQTSPVVIPPTPVSTTAEGLSGISQAMVEQSKLAKEQEIKAQEAQKGVTAEKGKLEGLMEKYLGVQFSRAGLEEEAGLGAKTQKVTDVTNQIEASQRAQTNELRALDGAGLTDVQRAAQAREINRKYAFEQADLALIQSAANRDLDTASRIIDRKIQLQLEPLQTQLEFTKFFYQENKELFTKEEDRAFGLKVDQLEKQYQTEKENRTAIANIQLEALKNGVQIPTSVISQLNNAKDAADATRILASNGISLQNPLEIENQKLQNLRLRQDIQEKIDANKPIVPINDPTKTAIENNAVTLDSIFSSSKVSAANKTSIGNALALASAAKDLADANEGGKFSGLYPGRGVVDFFLPKALKREKTVTNEALISALDLQTQFWASGAALSNAQTELVQKMIPTKTDTDKAIRAKTNQLVNYMLSQTATRLQTDGISYTPSKVNLFETTELLEKASPEQLEQLRVEGLIK